MFCNIPETQLILIKVDVNSTNRFLYLAGFYFYCFLVIKIVNYATS